MLVHPSFTVCSVHLRRGALLAALLLVAIVAARGPAQASHPLPLPLEASWSTFNYQPNVFWTYGCLPLNGVPGGGTLLVREGGMIDGQCNVDDPFFISTGTLGGTINFTSNAVTVNYDGALTFKPPSARTYIGTRNGQGTYDPQTHTASGSGNYAWHCEGAGCSAADRTGGTGTFQWTLTFSAADVKIDRIEIVQVVQDAANSVRLVAGKATIARVFVGGTQPVDNVQVTLKGKRGATELPGSPVLVNGSATRSVPTADRERKDHSFNFRLPVDWTGVGSITLEAEARPPVDVIETNVNNNKGSTGATFYERRGLNVAYLPVCHQPAGQAAPTCPGDGIAAGAAFMQQVFPVADNGITYQRVNVPNWIWTAPLASRVNGTALKAALRKRFDLMALLGQPADQLAAWTPPLAGIPLGSSDPKWAGSTGRVSYQQFVPADPEDGYFTLAHEIAHNIGLRHTNLPDGCGANDDTTGWPYSDSTTQEVGWNILTNEVVPRAKKDVMTYCSPPASNIWISPDSWEKLFLADTNPQGLSTAVSAQASQMIVISGSAMANGSSGELDPVYIVESSATPPASDPAGNHCLRFSGPSGNLGDFCFTLEFEDHRTHDPLPSEHFSLAVPLPAGADRVALRRGATELSAMTGDGSPPALEITSPQAGAIWQGTQTITWSASDADADDLRFAVLYSSDGGVTWLPLDVDMAATQYSLDTTQIRGGTNVMFRVLATDGFNTTDLSVGPVTVGLPGDADCDADVDAIDALHALRAVAGLSGTAGCVDSANVKCDDSLDAVDSLLILRRVAGLTVALPPGCPEMA